ncbi:MAG: alanine:cation symporter family protein [bacterium]|nr:alanine:cation symporter family protein [bacterium]
MNFSDLDTYINRAVQPVTDWLSGIVFFKIPFPGAEIPFVVLWLVAGGVVFTFYFRFVNLRLFVHALRLVRGDFSKASPNAKAGSSRTEDAGEVSHFQALATALSGTVGIGNIGGVAVAISAGGPGATFWMVLAGFLGMSTKFVECTLGVKYRREHSDGTVSGGPMFYLERGLAELGLPRLGRMIGVFYALGLCIGCLGIGNMFQSNQAYAQFLNVTGAAASPFVGLGWLFGLLLAACVGLVIIGGLSTIVRVTEKVVPLMALLYMGMALVVIGMNYEALPFAVAQIFGEAFTVRGAAGGALGAMVIGFQRAVFSNEAGIGSASIAHSAVRTKEPVTEGIVSLLEPFIDTVVICTTTALVIVTTLYFDSNFTAGPGGVEMTSRAFERNLSWSPVPLAFAALLFAFSTMVAWAYYGLKGWTYLIGRSAGAELAFKIIFCVFIVIGSAIQLDAVLGFSDALVFVICVPNILGLYLLAPQVKRELNAYLKSES